VRRKSYPTRFAARSRTKEFVECGAADTARPLCRATEYRVHQKALALREEAASLNAEGDEAFWNALFGPAA
jgi:hypothetical protein